MKLYIKQKVFALRDKFNIYDEYEEIKYQAEGEFISLGKKLHVYDRLGREVIDIRQRLFTFLPKYEFSILNSDAVEIIKKFTLLKHEYVVPELNLHILGDFLAHNYVVKRGETEIARLSKEWLTWGDTYVIDIYDPADELIVLAVILIIDCCMVENNAG